MNCRFLVCCIQVNMCMVLCLQNPLQSVDCLIHIFRLSSPHFHLYIIISCFFFTFLISSCKVFCRTIFSWYVGFNNYNLSSKHIHVYFQQPLIDWLPALYKPLFFSVSVPLPIFFVSLLLFLNSPITSVVFVRNPCMFQVS